MNEANVRSASKTHEFEICGRPVSMRISSNKSRLLYLRPDWQTAARISEVLGAERNSIRRLVQVTFQTGLPAPLTLDSSNADKFMCIEAKLDQKRIFAKSFTIRDTALHEKEMTVCGKVFEEEGLFGVDVVTERQRRSVLLVGRNTKETRRVLTSLAGELACVRGRPFLAQESLALLTDSDSIVLAKRDEFSLSDKWPHYVGDPEEAGINGGKSFIQSISDKTTDDKIELLTDHILHMEKQSEDYKWRVVEREVNGNGDIYDEWTKEYYDAEIIHCCDELNEIIGEKKDGGFFQKIFRKGANPSTMYMDGKNDFSELRKNELYEGDMDLELDLL
jgi:hypothetical protein